MDLRRISRFKSLNHLTISLKTQEGISIRMKYSYHISAVALLFLVLSACVVEKAEVAKPDFPVLTGAYLGQSLPTDSAEIFAPGITTVTYTLDDGNGNSSQCTFTVTHQVVDEIVVDAVDGTLTVETSGSYQWISCKDMSVIDGETGSSFSPGLTGEYAVIVTQGECSATSQCYSLDYTGLEMNGIQDGLALAEHERLLHFYVVLHHSLLSRAV